MFSSGMRPAFPMGLAVEHRLKTFSLLSEDHPRRYSTRVLHRRHELASMAQAQVSNRGRDQSMGLVLPRNEGTQPPCIYRKREKCAIALSCTCAIYRTIVRCVICSCCTSVECVSSHK